MEISELVGLYARHPGVAALGKLCEPRPSAPSASPTVGSSVSLGGLPASAAAMAFAACAARLDTRGGRPFLFLLEDEEAAGYFYHDLVQLMGSERVLFYPSAYRRAVKYAQRDAAGEILRTEVLGRLSDRRQQGAGGECLMVVSCPAAVAGRVAPPKAFAGSTVALKVGENYDLGDLQQRLV